MRNQLLEQIFHCLFDAFLLEVLFYDIYYALVILHIILPNTITPQQYELITTSSLLLFYVRLARYHLLRIPQSRHSLVIKVTQ